VLAIDGVPVKKILARLMTIARADGSNDAKRVSYLEVNGENNYEAFDVYFPMFFPPKNSQFELLVKEFDSPKSETINVLALTYEQRLAPIKVAVEARRGGSEQRWDFKYIDDHTAYLRMPTWSLFNSKWDWKKFLEDAFDQLTAKKTANLIIDLRGNEGGLSVGDVILSQLIKQNLRLESFKRLVRYRKTPDILIPYLDTWDTSFKDWGASAIDFKDGFYTLNRFDDTDGNIIKASNRPFEGRTFILVDSSNSSATFEFAQTLQQNKLAMLVGQPTGGNQRGINGGAFFFLRLPNSKIEIDLPLIGFFPPVGRPDAGLEPDVSVKPAIKDIAQNIDTVLNTLKKRLRSLR
jgi:C-terminal processing protease CtpA/Prc